MSEKEKMLAGEPYDPDDPELVADRERARELTRRYNATEPGADERPELLEDLLGSGGADATVEPEFRCDYGYNIEVGEGFYANFDCTILDSAPVEIGANTQFGPGVHVYTATHPLEPEKRAQGVEYAEPVSIGENVWVGGGAVINPGISIGDDSVVASGAVVVDDVPAGVVVGGNPARVFKEL